jgi:hypothetical protein
VHCNHLDDVTDEVVSTTYDGAPLTDHQSVVDTSSDDELGPANKENSDVESEAEPEQSSSPERYPVRNRREPVVVCIRSISKEAAEWHSPKPQANRLAR